MIRHVGEVEMMKGVSEADGFRSSKEQALVIDGPLLFLDRFCVPRMERGGIGSRDIPVGVRDVERDDVGRIAGGVDGEQRMSICFLLDR